MSFSSTESNNNHKVKKSKTNTVKSRKKVIDFACCRFCEWQFISKENNQKFTTKMYCHHLEKTHKLTKKEITNIINEVKEFRQFTAEERNYGENTNIKFMIDNGNRER